ncbi:MAG: nucleotide pyrophosphohydrolase [Candidatus Muirbacterium halophilum]|nr:nucleotide pyrophosphohydrolase [Candidatus Muirbacterium halophilum]
MQKDNNTTVDDLKKKMSIFIKERDWQKFHSPKNLAMSIAIEAAELMEHFQWISSEDAIKIKDNNENINDIKDELSDILSYCLSLANYLDIDITDSFIKKMEKNKKKYPEELAYGKNTKYNKLEKNN